MTGLAGTTPDGGGTGARTTERRGVVAVAPQSYQQEWMAAGKLHHSNPGGNVLLFWRFT